MKRPKLFKPTQMELEKVGKKIAENLSDQKVVIVGDQKIRGKIKK